MLIEILAAVSAPGIIVFCALWAHENGRRKHFEERKDYWYNKYEAERQLVWHMKHQVISQESATTRERQRADALEAADKRLKGLQSYLKNLQGCNPICADRQTVICDEIEKLMKVGEKI